MLRPTFIRSVIACGAALMLSHAAQAQQKVTLNVMTAGDQNMVDYVTDYLGPMFEKQNPGVTVRSVGTGPGDAGSQKIWERLDAQKKAGTATWDVDVAVIPQAVAGQMVKEGMLDPYRRKIATGKEVNPETPQQSPGDNGERH